MITLKIDDRNVAVAEGATVLDAAKKAGVWIPTLCHHEFLGSYQACRLCTVEVGQGDKARLHASCALPAKEGMVVRSDTSRVVEGRKVIMELLLARAPAVDSIRELAARIGVTETPFSHKDDDCVLCGLCVRACNDVMGVGAIGFKGRGIQKEVDTPFGEYTHVCKGCGACTYVCPTGKMQMEARQVSHFRTLQGNERQCRYVRMGVYSYKVCPNDYQCWRCQVDQSLEERFGTHPALVAAPGHAGDIEELFEFRFAPFFNYHRGHTWAMPLNGKIRVGIDDFASRLLNPVSDMFLPGMGRKYGQGEPAFRFKAADKEAQLLFPIEGRVVDVNPLLMDDPELAARAPYTRGWIATVEPENLRPDMDRLLHRSNARLWMKNERERLFQFAGGGTDMVAADGGLLLSDLPAKMDRSMWDGLVNAFFRP